MNLRSKIEQALAPVIGRYHCVASRYGLPYCLMLITHEIEDGKKLLQHNIRCADEVIEIDYKTLAILFFANHDNSRIGFANKILQMFEMKNPSKKVSIGIGCSCADGECSSVLTQAIRNLLEAQSLPNSMIMDE